MARSSLLVVMAAVLLLSAPACVQANGTSRIRRAKEAKQAKVAPVNMALLQAGGVGLGGAAAAGGVIAGMPAAGGFGGMLAGFPGLGAVVGASGSSKQSSKDLDNMVSTSTEQAVKLYLMAKNELVASDMTTFTEHLKPVRGKHGVMKKPAAEKCSLPDGCVRSVKLGSFLHNKYIPGSDNVLTPYLPEPGHITNNAATNLLKDFRYYLLTRPYKAVPEPVRKLLFPGADAQWPGGDGSDRSVFYPKSLAAGVGGYWETDIDELAQGAGMTEQPKAEAETSPLAGLPQAGAAVATAGAQAVPATVAAGAAGLALPVPGSAAALPVPGLAAALPVPGLAAAVPVGRRLLRA